MSIKTDLKQRFLKFEAVHGLYKIPLGGLLIYVGAINIPYLQAMLQLQFVLHDLAIFIGVKSVVEGLHDVLHNPVKKEALKVINRDKYIANYLQSGCPRR